MSTIKSITLEEKMKKNPQLKLFIQSLREWCKKQPHLPKIEDSFLALILHKNDYQMEPTKNTIENYYTIRTHLPEFFGNRDPLREKTWLQQDFKITTAFPLKATTKDGYKISYGSILDPDSSLYDFNNALRKALMSIDVNILIDGITDGYVMIFDISKLSFGHVTRMSPLALKKFLYYFQEAAPFRLKEIHVLNAPSAIEFLMNTIKPFMKKELIDMVHFHSSLKSLSEYIPVDALPNETGGKAGSVHEFNKIEMKKIEDYREWFLLDNTRCVNEALRIGKSKSASDLFGIEGSFRKLDID
ncbi:PREDICTED: alpha-tocopherol transfer protein-like isoform X1 [Wasmannia auropunctata]|uniref:alpha-tocopherol transfer protein-like isoform X1 n=1 Tax=Wasmannia auropunctata TaxID=64793 RepID=UPI0005EF0101|nr:PREDICTED: alpha-tocopherol transfer protein-like isoform X1 [Wasmannia auropunctata]